jgi:hypothetical protein
MTKIYKNDDFYYRGWRCNMKLSIGMNTLAGVIFGIVFGVILWLIGAGLAVIAVLPAGSPIALFFIGFACSIGYGILADQDEE